MSNIKNMYHDDIEEAQRSTDLKNKNLHLTQEVEDAGFILSKLFHIGMMSESPELHEFLYEIPEDLFNIIFKCKLKFDELSGEGAELTDILCQSYKLGFVAEVRYSVRTNFRKDEEGNVVSCRVLSNAQDINYIYGESIVDVIMKAKQWASDRFIHYLTKWEREQKTNSEKHDTHIQ